MRTNRQEHQHFLENMIIKLLKEGGDPHRVRPNPPFITQSMALRDNHEWQALKSIRTCFMCRKDYKERGFRLKISGNALRTPRIKGGRRSV